MTSATATSSTIAAITGASGIASTAAIGIISPGGIDSGIGVGGDIGGVAAAGATLLISDLHCSQNNAPSSLPKPQNGHFTMTA
jgi:hypothetical protein